MAFTLILMLVLIVTKVTGRGPGGSFSRAEHQLRQAGLSDAALAAVAVAAAPPARLPQPPPYAPPTSASGEAVDIAMGGVPKKKYTGLTTRTMRMSLTFRPKRRRKGRRGRKGREKDKKMTKASLGILMTRLTRLWWDIRPEVNEEKEKRRNEKEESGREEGG